MENILIIGDTHEPFCLPDYLDFCVDTKKRFKCKRIIHIGDEVDNHAISYHEHDPDGSSPGDEFEIAKRKLHEWEKAFPVMEVCIGNHTALMFRKAYTAGIPKNMLRTYNRMWEINKWCWVPEINVNNIWIKHGTRISGRYGHINYAKEARRSIVIGHLHSTLDCYWMFSEVDAIFAMVVGCGIDRKAYSMQYGKEFPRKPAIGCGVLLENGTLPLPIPMRL